MGVWERNLIIDNLILEAARGGMADELIGVNWLGTDTWFLMYRFYNLNDDGYVTIAEKVDKKPQADRYCSFDGEFFSESK